MANAAEEDKELRDVDGQPEGKSREIGTNDCELFRCMTVNVLKALDTL